MYHALISGELGCYIYIHKYACVELRSWSTDWIAIMVA